MVFAREGQRPYVYARAKGLSDARCQCLRWLVTEELVITRDVTRSDMQNADGLETISVITRIVTTVSVLKKVLLSQSSTCACIMVRHLLLKAQSFTLI